MEIYKVKDYEEMSKLAAEFIEKQIKEKPHTVLGLATGSTPEGLYNELIKKFQDGGIDFSKVKTVNLDEYKGLDRQNIQSYYYYMYNHLFKNINIDLNNAYIPNGMSEDGEEECKNYENAIKDIGGIDLQVLGIGDNGHIGFNEPSEVFEKETHQVALAKATIDANARFFENTEDVPRFAYTMGLKSIMTAKKIILLVSGVKKANILKKALYGPITPHVPASVLQLHNNLSVIVDEEASKEI